MKSNKASHSLLKGLHTLVRDETSLPFTDFAQISETLMDGYALFVRRGYQGHAVALAMLGATINVYTLFQLEDELPDLLRGLADMIEQGGQPH